jgi:hypothetical protein
MFTHANYVGLKENDKNLVDLFIHMYSNRGTERKKEIIIAFCYCGNMLEENLSIST